MPINPWIQGRVPGIPIYPPLGCWLNRRKLASAGWVPPQWARLSLEGMHAYWYQFPALTLTKGQTDLTRVTISEDFWILAIMAAPLPEERGGAGSFRFQIYEDVNTYKYAKYGINAENGASIAQQPGLVKMPHYIEAGSPVNCRIQNLDGANTKIVRLCMFGVSQWWRK
jgi:hypothetical protein